MSDQYDGPAMAQKIIRLQAENEKLRADAERAEAERNIAVGMLSGCPAYSNKHPQDVLGIVIDSARGEK